MTRPETCGAAGGAISVWVNVVDCHFGGIISSGAVITSYNYYGKTGLQIHCYNNELRYEKEAELSAP